MGCDDEGTVSLVAFHVHSFQSMTSQCTDPGRTDKLDKLHPDEHERGRFFRHVFSSASGRRLNQLNDGASRHSFVSRRRGLPQENSPLLRDCRYKPDIHIRVKLKRKVS